MPRPARYGLREPVLGEGLNWSHWMLLAWGRFVGMPAYHLINCGQSASFRISGLQE